MGGTSLQYMYYWIRNECIMFPGKLWFDLPGKHFASCVKQLK